ncbi:MAG TPA: hypothetical protein VGR84_18970 [Candidatus Acidoferrales bacterium]|nr:hypothetical protein [Candidatus Acidoferrales bacterium]
MAVLSDYSRMVKGLLHDRGDKLLQLDDVEIYINRARRDIALRTQCIRILPPISGPLVSLTITTPGSGYTSPTLTISAPDFPSGYTPNPAGLQATGTISQTGGALSGAVLTNPGNGYFQPTVTITDPTGTGGVVTAQTIPLTVTTFGQEVYKFSSFPMPAGVDAPFAVFSIAMIFNGYRYTLVSYPFTDYQTFIRNYPQQYLYVPTLYSQYGQGSFGSLYFYPLPSQVYQFEADCLCLPIDLTSDSDEEALPPPWQDAVAFYAAHLCYLELVSFNNARAMLDLYNERVSRYSMGARPRYLGNSYGRW